MKSYFVYILSSRSGVLYVGVTNDLEHRLLQHRAKVQPGFTAKYHCTILVWYETFHDVNTAIETEKRIKGWRRSRKIELIEKMNPTWRDLSEGWFDDQATSAGPRSLGRLGSLGMTRAAESGSTSARDTAPRRET